ncbi:MAG TPA: RDD family protein [Thermoanaerobaculia bacterium]|nr:RDD family protein [Thermoanaerobaculia bacterium]HUM30598.1 RDD family protein [Thermoanaerobaculia bacterium]HXK68874.1 RDD family protein [Thermoanaerobaculia bacterium]
MTAAEYAPPVEVPRNISAGFWVRFIALFLDLLLLFIFVKILGIVELLVYNRVMEATILDAGGNRFNEIRASFRLIHTALILGIPFLYFSLFEGMNRGATPGKRALGLRVIRSSFQSAGYFRAGLRTAMKALSAIPFLLGFVIAAFLPGKRGLHDLLSGCRVVHNRPYLDWMEGSY